MPFAQEQMGFNRPPKLFLRQDTENATNPLGKTGFYDPKEESITIYVTDRHPKDILRSLSHELMHHTQKCNGDFNNAEGMGEQGYAQNNPHMRNMEIQAYQASIVFRDWEDSLKETIYYEHLQKGANKTMSMKNWRNRELNGLLMERFGFKFNALDNESIEEGGLANRKGDPRQRRPEASPIREDEEEEKLEEERLDEMTGLEPLIGGLVAAGLEGSLAASIGQLAVGGGLGAALLGLLSKHDPGLSPEAQAIASGKTGGTQEIDEVFGGVAPVGGGPEPTRKGAGGRRTVGGPCKAELQGNYVDGIVDKNGNCVPESHASAPTAHSQMAAQPARAVAEEGFMGFGKKDAGGEDADGDGCVDAAAGPCKRCKNKGGKWIAGQGGAGKCVYGDITEAQIREIAKRVIERLKKTTK